MGPRSGCAVGTCGQPRGMGGPRRSGAEGSGFEARSRLCRRAGEPVPEPGRRSAPRTAGGSAAGRQRRRPPRRRARREMPGEQRAGDGNSGYPQNCGSRVVFSSSTLKAVQRRGRGNWLLLFQSVKVLAFWVVLFFCGVAV